MRQNPFRDHDPALHDHACSADNTGGLYLCSRAIVAQCERQVKLADGVFDREFRPVARIQRLCQWMNDRSFRQTRIGKGNTAGNRVGFVGFIR